MAGIVQQIYQGFLLRDLFGKAVPGTVTLAALLWLSGIAINQFQFPFKVSGWSIWQWALGFGVVWLLGFVAQFPVIIIEEVVFCVRYRGLASFYRKLHALARKYKGDDECYEIKQRTRLTLLYEASGNMACATVYLAVTVKRTGIVGGRVM